MDIPIFLVISIWLFVYPPVEIVGNSMKPTLGQSQVFTTKFPFSLDRGDIVVYQPRSYQFVGRIVGLPGESIEIAESKVYINNQVLEESYLEKGTNTSDYPKTSIPEGSYFIMGDNRPYSLDSRFEGTGFVKTELIKRELGICVLNCQNPDK